MRSIILYLINHIIIHLILVTQHRRYFNNQPIDLILHHLLKVIWRNRIIYYHLLNLFDGVRVKQHATEDEQGVGEGLHPVGVVGGDVTVAAGAQGCGDEVEAGNVLLLELVLRYVFCEHPALFVVSVCAEHYRAASQEVDDYTSLYSEGKDFQPLLDVLFFEDGPVFAIVIHEADNCCVNLEKTVKSRKLKQENGKCFNVL